jgi:dimethylaniline monooxygenase (N-oxide forming)
MELNTDELDGANKVCVVGSGALGLVAMKNLMEQGLEVQAFEKNEYVGGIWHVSLDPSQTSALSGTRAQFSKQVVSGTIAPH